MRLLQQPLLICLLSVQGFILLSRFSACSSSSEATGNQNLSRSYRTEKEVLHPSYTVFHRTGTTSELHFRVSSKELLYSKQAGNENFSARVRIHYRLISSYETKDIIDSGTVNLTDPYSSTPRDIIGKTDFSATFTNTYLLQVEMTDLNRNAGSKTLLAIDKLNNNTRQNYIVLSHRNRTPLFREYTAEDERFFVRYRSAGGKLYVRYYNRHFPLPQPPFSISNMIPFEYKADKVFSIETDENDTLGYCFTNTGFYHVQSDTFSKDGFTLFRFGKDFPHVRKPEQMLQALRYLTSKQEFESMTAKSNPKAAVDSFWVAAGGSHDRARELVKKYYNRVEDANEYFTSYLEGWKTDRGLIYIIYGPPNVVYKGSDSENWVYGEENNFNSASFTFLKVINPFTDNDYRLERNQIYRNGWLNAVDMWRQGRVYAEK